jgi:hypothetical protein
MTRDDINKIIFDNELFHGVLTGMGVVMDIEHLEKFANIVAAAEREACAKDVSNALYGQVGCGKAIEAIRAMGQ